MEINKILLPLDFTPGSEAAVPYALDLARRYGARLYVLHVIYEVEKDFGWYAPQLRTDELYRGMEEGASREFEKVRKTLLEDFSDVEFVLLVGVPYEEILRFASEKDIDLVVMGTHGRKGIERMFFGSTASKVVKDSARPVLTVRMS